MNQQSVWGLPKVPTVLVTFLHSVPIVQRINSSVHALFQDQPVSQRSTFVLNMQGNHRINCSFAKISKLIQDHTDTAVFRR